MGARRPKHRRLCGVGCGLLLIAAFGGSCRCEAPEDTSWSVDLGYEGRLDAALDLEVVVRFHAGGTNLVCHAPVPARPAEGEGVHVVVGCRGGIYRYGDVTFVFGGFGARPLSIDDMRTPATVADIELLVEDEVVQSRRFFPEYREAGIGEPVEIDAEDACELESPQAQGLVIFDYESFEME